MGLPKTRAEMASMKCSRAMNVSVLKVHTDRPFLAKDVPSFEKRSISIMIS